MYNVHLTHSLLCFEFVEFTLNYYSLLNRYLKRIAEICRIKRNWVFHAARHTYATEIISSGSRTGILPGITPM